MAPMFQESPVASAVNGAANGAINGHPLKSKAAFARTVVSHPTRSLQFLKGLNEEEVKEPLQAKVKLRVIVVGGGLGGLACAIALSRRGHTVTVLEQAVQLGEVRSLPIDIAGCKLTCLTGRCRHTNSVQFRPPS
jgi:hypothetical protein